LLHLATFLWLAGEKLLVWAVVFECQWKKWCAFEYFDLCQNPIVFFVEAVRGQRWILKWIEFTVTSKQTCLYRFVNWRGENWIHHLRSWMMVDGSEAIKAPISPAPGFLASSRHPLSRAQLHDWCFAWSEQCPAPHPNGVCSRPLRGVGMQAGGVYWFKMITNFTNLWTLVDCDQTVQNDQATCGSLELSLLEAHLEELARMVADWEEQIPKC